MSAEAGSADPADEARMRFVLALRSRGAGVRIVGPDADAAEEMGVQFMDPGPAKAVHAAGYAQGLRLGSG